MTDCQKKHLNLYLIFAAKALRTFAFGCISVFFALYLLEKAFNSFQIGLILSATLIVDAVSVVLVTMYAEQLGRKTILIASSFLLCASGMVFAFANSPALIVAGSILGIVSPAGYEGGSFGAIEQSLVSDLVSSDEMPKSFSIYNLSGFAGAASGALLAGLAFPFLHKMHAGSAYPVMFTLYASCGLFLALIYLFLDSGKHRVLQKPQQDGETNKAIRKQVWSLSILQGIDAFGGGFVPQTLIACWFFERFQTGPEFSGPVFFITNVLAAVSFFIAPYVCRRFGLLNTMVFTHLPCSVTLCLLPFMSSAWGAASILIARSLLSSMDIPARQAYAMVLVEEKDRSAAAGMTTAGRSIGQCAAPVFSGLAFSSAWSGLPFIYAGACKTFYDLCLFALFRDVPLQLQNTENERTSN